jgi:sugar phosphate isomerase/epimerase
MKLSQVAAITSSVGRFARDPEGIADTLKKIREIGYEAVQISGIGEIDPRELRRITDELGLRICATHEKNTMFVESPEAIVEKLEILGCTIAGYPYPHTGKVEEEEDVDAIAAALEHAGEVLTRSGMTVVYHNHNLELVRLGEKTALELIYERTDPQRVQGEPDTYWIQAGGGDPVAWCEKLAGRMPVLHMKDYGMQGKEPVMTSIGAGNLDWTRICSAAEASGCQWYVVEHDGGTFESLAASYAWIRDRLCE